MAKPPKLGPGTEGGKLILQDFLQWKKTGFKPWAKSIGTTEHWKSRKIYQGSSVNAFRAQAKKIAKIALEQMPADEIEKGKGGGEEDEFHMDSENKNPWKAAADDDDDEYGDEEYKLLDEGEYDEDADEDFTTNVDEEMADNDDDELDEEYQEINKGELAEPSSTMLIEHPNKKKVGVVFVCDGDVSDKTATQIEFPNKMQLRLMSRVPRERLNAKSLIGTGHKDEELEFEDFGYSDADLMVLDAVIQQRMAGLAPDCNGDYWYVREEVNLPFACSPFLYDKKGRRIEHYKLRRNKYGFTWGFFWLVADREKKEVPARISGGKVTLLDDASDFTEKTMK